MSTVYVGRALRVEKEGWYGLSKRGFKKPVKVEREVWEQIAKLRDSVNAIAPDPKPAYGPITETVLDAQARGFLPRDYPAGATADEYMFAVMIKSYFKDQSVQDLRTYGWAARWIAVPVLRAYCRVVNKVIDGVMWYYAKRRRVRAWWEGPFTKAVKASSVRLGEDIVRLRKEIEQNSTPREINVLIGDPTKEPVTVGSRPWMRDTYAAVGEPLPAEGTAPAPTPPAA